MPGYHQIFEQMPLHLQAPTAGVQYAMPPQPQLVPNWQQLMQAPQCHLALQPGQLPPAQHFPSAEPQQGVATVGEGRITTASVSVWKLPKSLLSECVEAIQSDLDATVTASLSQAGLATLLWLMTKVKPDMKVTEPRVELYSHIYMPTFKPHAIALSEQTPAETTP
jgi:hypothetical protein